MAAVAVGSGLRLMAAPGGALKKRPRRSRARMALAGPPQRLIHSIFKNLRTNQKCMYTASFSRGVEQSGSSLGS